jgi:hypothetical protein
MAGLPWRDAYHDESTDALLALEGHYRTDSIIVVFEQAVGQKAARAGDAGLSPEEYAILAIEALEREVNNGGYSQFFTNSSKEHAARVVEALEAIGCPRFAAVTRDAVSALGISGPVTEAAVDAAMDGISDERLARLSACDAAYSGVAGEDIAARLLAFIKEHRSAIRLP